MTQPCYLCKKATFKVCVECRKWTCDGCLRNTYGMPNALLCENCHNRHLRERDL
jgi:hypothetical protein